jgi:hypothetical protein
VTYQPITSFLKAFTLFDIEILEGRSIHRQSHTASYLFYYWNRVSHRTCPARKQSKRKSRAGPRVEVSHPPFRDILSCTPTITALHLNPSNVRQQLEAMEFTKVQEIELPAAFDAHVHLRDGEMSQLVTPTVRQGGVNQCYVMVSFSKTTCWSHIAYSAFMRPFL